MKTACYSCHKAITGPSAIVFSPPFKHVKDMALATVHQYHLCLNCWQILFKCIENLEEVKIERKVK